MLSARSRYALRALSYLARQAPAPQTTEQIASATGVPLPTLAKILQILSHTGIVKTQRGVGGGVELARQPELVSVKEVIDAFDTAIVGEALPEAADGGCLEWRLRVLRSLSDLILTETSIAELAASEGKDSPRHSSVDTILERLVRAADLQPNRSEEGTGQPSEDVRPSS